MLSSINRKSAHLPKNQVRTNSSTIKNNTGGKNIHSIKSKHIQRLCIKTTIFPLYGITPVYHKWFYTRVVNPVYSNAITPVFHLHRINGSPIFLSQNQISNNTKKKNKTSQIKSQTIQKKKNKTKQNKPNQAKSN